MHTLEKNFATPARCAVDKADNGLSRAHLPGSDKENGTNFENEGPDGKD